MTVEWVDCSAIEGHRDMVRLVSQLAAVRLDDLMSDAFKHLSQRVELSEALLLGSMPRYILERLVKGS